ncbi:bifunctional adenosylcobinamide kinase/adenosylcobinamide-phosphate guanylyltransferase [Actinacidiphila sp. bgisy167]|uniref:bifunctional adenosylcobinamide kinase/adenosylcobinamide-phosphate guanylyltransferase n=1 Tax=Actinacidiphila sp. bgisy167 TaxID=3413797 RepID=UPI003D743490
MELTLLGTGGPDGLPLPGCPCAACATAVGAHARAATSLLVDGVLLLDLTPGLAFTAARSGHSLAAVRQVLLSHPHDGPAVEIPAGLPAPGRLAPGQEITLLTGHRVRSVPLDAPGSGYEVTGPDGERLLYLPPQCAPAGLPEAMEPYDLVLLDAVGRPEALARLRAAGAVGHTTDVVALHLDHRVHPGPQLRRRLAPLGVRAVPDGTTLTVGDLHEVPDVPRRTLVLGGARSGKSVEAERRLMGFPGVVYAATGGTRGGDAEWAERVALHQERRPPSWQTVETCDLVPLLAEGDGRALLIDCLSLWLTHTMDELGAWDDERWAQGAERELRRRVTELAAAWRATRRTVVAVSNEVGSGVVPATASGRRFRDELGRLNVALAEESEHVVLVVAGQVLALRG